MTLALKARLLVNKTDIIAKTMIVFMVKGLFTSLAFPYAFFPCATVSGDMLYKPLWDCILQASTMWFQGIIYNC